MSTAAASVATPVQQLQDRLADPGVADSLLRLIDRADLVAFALDALDGFLRRSDTVVESVSQGVREIGRTAGGDDTLAVLAALPTLARRSVDVADVAARPAFANLLRSDLVDRLGDPRTIALLDTLLDKLETAVFALEALDGFLRRGDEIAESASAIVGELRRAPIDLRTLSRLTERLPALLDTLEQLTESRALELLPAILGPVKGLAESGMLDDQVVRILGDFGRRAATAYNEVQSQPVAPVGAFGLARALSEPEVQRTIGLLIAVARRIGRDLK